MHRFWVTILSLCSLLACLELDQSGLPNTDGGWILDDSRVSDSDGIVCVDQCMNDTQYCDPTGVVVDCPLGCTTAGGAHCLALVPSNTVDVGMLANVIDSLIVPSGVVTSMDTDTGAITNDGSPVTADFEFMVIDDDRSVLAVDSVTVEATGRLRPLGTRALIILSRNDVNVAGLIDISGTCSGSASCPGPGGGGGATNVSSAAGCGPGDNGDGSTVDDETGGGGGAMGQAGGSGGIGLLGSPQGGEGGEPTFCPDATLEPLRGGSGGGEGGYVGGNGGDGGGGGGGLQITSLTRITFAPGGEIWAGGAGGSAPVASADDGGGGGGSGGAILLEAPEILVANATLTANGGSGGGGGDGAQAGSPGPRDTTQAPSGSPGPPVGSPGGRGGSLDGDAEPGGGNSSATGGGGGGYGIIRLNVPESNLDLSNAIVSPAHTRGDLTLQ